MKGFINDTFMLKNETAKTLYGYIKDLPIIDYHCHLSPKDIAENRQFKNLTEIWLEGDHYKWRAMRANGVDEHYITGDASAKDKFRAWAQTVPNTLGNPLYHWTHLELKKYFDINVLLDEQNWEDVWSMANEKLAQLDFSVQKLIERSNVESICTTDSPVDQLDYHKQIKAQDNFNVTVLPTFRPDDGMEITKPIFRHFIDKLSTITNRSIRTYRSYIEALEERIDYFDEMGCKLSDHGLAKVPFSSFTDVEIEAIFQKALAGEGISTKEELKFKTAMMVALARKYKESGWTMQLHFGAIRNNNTKMFKRVGKDAGFDSISDQSDLGASLNGLLDQCEKNDGLPQTILYNLNPIYNNLVGSAIQNFQTEPGIKMKVQLGSGWWFNDTRQGMERQLATLADQGLLMHFVGMLTDSRSFLSFSRHEYFRRVLANLIGQWVEEGELPNNESLLKRLVTNISYYNAKRYFKSD
ncbi:glucuronate isomerase [Amphibacillus jilinensis]|uniref:glucuronate isomerase n=1 Tax=Amphibacillus jilinensis TaxID=1216008 RepID=UPI0002F31E60|nr:glucuronate isomerase [Amphibacillus jilinensis]